MAVNYDDVVVYDAAWQYMWDDDKTECVELIILSEFKDIIDCFVEFRDIIDLNQKKLKDKFQEPTKGIFHLLQNLKVLRLQNNSFSRQFNHSIGHLSSLVELDISSNSFSRVLPDMFTSLGKLEKFSACSNNFNETLPVSLLNSPSIMSLDLHNNSLNGPVNLNCSAMVHLKNPP
ncbi:hypothetical protein GQ457_16G008160 [Hibiscus cannabinus]